MNPTKLIIKKRDKQELTKKEISYFISHFLNGQIKEYQMSAMLMAILLNNMTFEETFSLTENYISSGKTLKFSDSNMKLIDKHSTGGVGDKISIHLSPIIAACGLFEPMISGRGLGHTGGTLDKLESIPGFQTEIKYF